jgi:hypothetical protein
MSAGRRGRRAILALAAFAAFAAPGAHGSAQSPAVAVLGDTARVGDVVPVAVRVTVDPGERVLWPPVLHMESDDLENAARVRELVDTLPDGRLQATAVYSITPWRPGAAPLPELTIQVEAADGASRPLVVTLPVLDVASVLPLDSEALQPIPAKGVIGASYPWWLFALLAFLALAGTAAVAWWLTRRRAAAPGTVIVPSIPPRDQALAALRDARTAGLVESGRWKEFYTRVAHALRIYLEALDPAWSEDLTTTELVARVRADAGHDHAAALARILAPADQVKFARRAPTAGEAVAEWETAVEWVEHFEWPPAARFEEVAA